MGRFDGSLSITVAANWDSNRIDLGGRDFRRSRARLGGSLALPEVSFRRRIRKLRLPLIRAVLEHLEQRPHRTEIVTRAEAGLPGAHDLAECILVKRRRARPVLAGLRLEAHVLEETRPARAGHPEFPAA